MYFNDNELKNLLDRMKQLDWELEFSPIGASEATITEAESSLRVSFPQSYKEFLSKYGLFAANGNIIAGIWRDLNSPSASNVVTLTEAFRISNLVHDVKKNFVVLSFDGDWYEGLDTSRSVNEGDSSYHCI
ncbi:SMI1/KNR4 family protein [Pseudobacteriovorax antillogorgiicola]|uniref:SMI1-KNR4 cell-wall n=1 Tax=Pseudobacteriovorax antillogorgiicola TaxID=1513793 RepID=A0A1Y6C9T6_9BACT|nr:SMI1/KNR4 family protein [Pseudobacteriovorax antillogorgiicola]TCS49004.1 SUKH superfamily protein [Pseudobacteriovorax antillogorgiicola]SMF53220.1 SMI1-KNR4 cell-wall [Pseudobacteriovorax antillogorgiicola]